MAKYNGHPSRNYWNVNLWIGNDEGLYRLALECIRETKTRRAAAHCLLETLRQIREPGYTTVPVVATPDGSPYTIASIMHAMRGMGR